MVAVKLDSAKEIRSGEELDLSRLQEYLLDRLSDASGKLTIQQFPSGWSNLTYLLKLGDQELVLRRPPFGNQVKSAHDMGREFKVLSKLCEVFAPAPRPYLYCQDPEIIGDEFYVMERRQGVVIRTNPPEALAENPQLVRQLCESFVNCLCELHAVDFASAGLGDLGRPDGYIERQVLGWTKRYEKSKTDDHDCMDRLGRWLADNLPPDGQPTLIHNDFKHDNLMLSPEDLTKITAVLDWEMTTLGDPLMDLGTTLAYWVEPGDDAARRMIALGPTTLAGSFTRQEFADRYAMQSGVSTDNVLFYYCYGLYKLAVVAQQIYARFARGATQDQRFKGLNQGVLALAKTGTQAIETGQV